MFPGKRAYFDDIFGATASQQLGILYFLEGAVLYHMGRTAEAVERAQWGASAYFSQTNPYSRPAAIPLTYLAEMVLVPTHLMDFVVFMGAACEADIRRQDWRIAAHVFGQRSWIESLPGAEQRQYWEERFAMSRRDFDALLAHTERWHEQLRQLLGAA